MTGKDRLDFVVRALRQHADEFRARGVVHMAVFGSVARGEAGPDSDVDLVVDLDYSKHPTLFDLMDFEEIAETVLDSDVDLVSSGGLRPAVAAAIARDRIPVF